MPSRKTKGASGKGKAGAKGKASGATTLGVSSLVGIVKPTPRRGPARGAKVIRKTVSAVMPCDVLALMAARVTDKDILTEHLQAIADHKQKYQDRIAAARLNAAAGNAAHLQAIPAHKAKITEAIGEHESTLLVVQDYAAATDHFALRSGFSAGVGIDQIWHSAHTDTFMLVEAKGPGATLSTGAIKGDQMSKQWVRNSLNAIVSSPTCAASDKADAKRMLTAMDMGPPPHVIGKVIEANPGGGATERGCPDKGIYHAT